jgi:uncharacterized protein
MGYLAVKKLLFPFWNDEEGRIRAFWRLLLHLVVTFVAILATAPLLLLLAQLGLDESATPFFIVGVVAQSVAISVASGISFVLFDRRSFASLRFDRGYIREFLLGCLIGAGLMASIFFICMIFRWVRIERIAATSLPSLVNLVAWQIGWLALMLLVGISEEFFSRGEQLKNLAEGMKRLGIAVSTIFAVFFSSAFFGVLHLGNPNATWFSTLSITTAGVMLATARIVSGRLALPIGIHTTWNYFQGPVFGFPVSGQETANSFMEVTSTGPSWLTGAEFGPEAGMLGLLALTAGALLIILWRKRYAPDCQRPLLQDLIQLVRYRAPRPLKAQALGSTNAVSNDEQKYSLPANGNAPRTD